MRNFPLWTQAYWQVSLHPLMGTTGVVYIAISLVQALVVVRAVSHSELGCGENNNVALQRNLSYGRQVRWLRGLSRDGLLCIDEPWGQLLLDYTYSRNASFEKQLDSQMLSGRCCHGLLLNCRFWLCSRGRPCNVHVDAGCTRYRE